MILDQSDNNPALTEAVAKPYEGFIFKLYPNGARDTHQRIAVAEALGKPWALYTADSTITWPLTLAAMHDGGFEPGKVALYQDWFEFLTKPPHGFPPEEAASRCEDGVWAAHVGSNVKLGGYGAELNAWVYYDRAKVPFDSRWVANTVDRPKIAYDVWQSGKNGYGDNSTLFGTNHADAEDLFATLIGPWKEAPPVNTPLTPEEHNHVIWAGNYAFGAAAYWTGQPEPSAASPNARAGWNAALASDPTNRAGNTHRP